MRKTLLLTAAALAAAAPASAAERRFSVADFDRVQIEGPYQVILRTGRTSSATASGAQGAIDRLSVEVQGRTLKVRANRSAWTGSSAAGGPVVVELTTRDINAASLNGSGRLDIDSARGLKLDLTVAGNGRLSVGRIEADNLVLALVGGGQMILAGRAKQLRATVQGSGDLSAEGLTADDAILFAETAGRVAFAAARTAKVRASGMGEVDIAGKATCEVQARGGPVRCGRQR